MDLARLVGVLDVCVSDHTLLCSWFEAPGFVLSIDPGEVAELWERPACDVKGFWLLGFPIGLFNTLVSREAQAGR